MANSMGHVFVSYDRQDQKYVDYIVEMLETSGTKVWIDSKSLVPGASWKKTIHDAIRNASTFLICLGERKLSEVRETELRLAVQLEDENSTQIILILLPGAKPSSVPANLAQRVWLDLRNGVEDQRAMIRLISAVESASVEGEVAQGQLAGDTLKASGDFSGAIKSYERAYLSARTALGASNSTTVQTLTKLAAAKHEAGLLSEALADIELTVETLRRSESFGESPEAATALNNLASVLRDMGRLDEAEALFGQALEIDNRVLGPDHPSVSNRLNNLASVLRDRGRLEEAEALFRQALEIDNRVLGPDHPSVSNRLNNLASVLRDTGRFDEAEALFRQALEIDNRVLGPDHPSVSNRLNNLASVLRDTGRFDEAEALFRQAFEIDNRVLGPDHPSVSNRLNNLASVLRDMGRLDEAEALFRQALEIDNRVLGPDHPSVSNRLNNLASVLRDTGRFDEAEALFRQALEIDSRVLGPDHPSVAITLNNLAGLTLEQGNSQQALKDYRRAIEILTSYLGEEHSLTQSVRANIARMIASGNETDSPA